MTRILLLAVMAFCGTGIAQQPEPYTVSVDVDLVLLNVHVLERNGQPVAGLDAANFRIFEDQRLQQISLFSGQDAPATVGLIVDSSGSMGPKWRDVQTAVASFAEDSNPQDEMFVVQFNENIHFSLPGGLPFTNDVADLRSALAGVVPSGTTALYDALAAALEHVRFSRFEKKIFVIVSDGSDNASRQPLDPLLIALQQANVTIYTVGLYEPEARDQNPKVLKRLGAVTGGEAFFPGTPDAIQKALRRIAAGIRDQYTLGYYPSVAADGRYHKLAVSVQTPLHPKYSVHTRPGYFARSKTERTGR